MPSGPVLVQAGPVFYFVDFFSTHQLYVIFITIHIKAYEVSANSGINPVRASIPQGSMPLFARRYTLLRKVF